MIKATLSIVNYNGYCCYDGKSGMQEALKGSYDLILLDVMLPEMNGFDVMNQIKNCGTPVIFLTAVQDVADKVKGLRLGAEIISSSLSRLWSFLHASMLYSAVPIKRRT